MRKEAPQLHSVPRYSAIATCTRVPRSAPRGFWPMRNDPMIHRSAHAYPIGPRLAPCVRKLLLLLPSIGPIWHASPLEAPSPALQRLANGPSELTIRSGAPCVLRRPTSALRRPLDLPNSLGVQLRLFALWQQGRNALEAISLSGFCSTHVNDWRNGDRSVATGKRRIGSHQSLWFSAALTSMIGATVTAVKAQHCTEPPLDPQCARVIPATAGVCPPSCRKLPPPGGSRHRT